MQQVMKGIRVLEVAQYTFVPAAGAVLADWGADVIKVEHPVSGDGQRGLLRVGGRDNTLWIRMRDTAEGRPYRILDPSGELLGTLTLPLNSRIAVADLRQIWVIEIDELDVESVVRYRLQLSPKDAT